MDLEAEFADTSLKNYKKGLVDMATIYKGYDPKDPNRLFGELIQETPKQETPKIETVQQEKPLAEEEVENQRLRKMMIVGIVVAVVVGILISMVIF